MGGEQSRPAPQAEKPKRERKKPEHKNKNKNEKENSTNIKDYPALHLKLITNIVCDKRTEHNSLSGEEITKLLSKIHKLSSPKEMK